MPRDFLSFWLPETAKAERVQGGVLLHCASSQYGRLRGGDTVWIVTVRPPGRLRLVGRVPVAQVVDHTEAGRILKCDPGDLWDAKYHVIVESKQAQPLADVPLGRIAGGLRFLGAGDRDRLTVSGGLVMAEQLRKMHRLAPESAEALRRIWEARDRPPRSWKKYPVTLEEAVQFVIRALRPVDRDELRKCRRRDLFLHHHGLGQWIRNNLGLWGQNPALLKALAGKTEIFYFDADWASGVIIAAVWKELRRKGEAGLTRGTAGRSARGC